MIALLAGIVALFTPGPDLSTPEATLNSFVSALSDSKLEDASSCVQGGVYGDAIKLLQTFFQEHPVKWGADIKNTVVDGDDAKVTCTVKVSAQNYPDAKPLQGSEEFATLHHDSDGWHLVSRTPDELVKEFNDHKDDSPTEQTAKTRKFINAFVTAFRYDEFAGPFVKAFIASARQAEALLKMHKLGLALLLLSVDKDDDFPDSQEEFRNAIVPYLKKVNCEDVLERLNDHDGIIWMLNPTFFGKSAESIEHPEKTVMIYESDHGELKYPYGGKALVEMADGKTRFVTEEEALKLLWQPKN